MPNSYGRLKASSTQRIADSVLQATVCGMTEEAAEKVIFVIDKEPQGLKPCLIFNVLRHD